MAEITTLAGFNPLPAVRPGGTDHWQPSIRWRVSFNPLPAVRPGGTVGDDGTPVFTKVSIRSRLLGREEPVCGQTKPLARLYVSIRSRLLGREEPRKVRASTWAQRFQSAPGC